MAERYPDIRSWGADVVAIAVTPTFSQMAFAERVGADFPLVSDWGGETSAAYGVRYTTWKGHAGVAKRALFVVDTLGKVAYRWWTDEAEELPDLSAAMTTLQHLADASGGEIG